MEFRHGSLFSGIGGFDLAAEWMGWNNIFHCEWNAFGQRILKYYWPEAISYEDITKTDFTKHRGAIDILTGGFPCQPYSVAGKRKGKEDERHLWPEMLRAIREIQPRYIVGENVGGLINWGGGLVFDEVQSDMEAAGYEVWPYILPACGKNAPHRRDRVWFIAHADCDGLNRGNGNHEINASKRGEHALNDIKQIFTTDTQNIRLYGSRNTWDRRTGFENNNTKSDFTGVGSNPGKIRLQNQEPIRKLGWGFGPAFGDEQDFWAEFPTQSPICFRNDGVSSKLGGITFSKWREESIKGGGNAIVPQIAFEIFKAIEQLELTL